MECFTIRLVEVAQESCCAKCGAHYRGRAGFGLFTEENDRPMCRTCGKKWAPTMVALLDLAHTAERIGKRSRHLLTPPMESLLDLAHAAENYSHTAPNWSVG